MNLSDLPSLGPLSSENECEMALQKNGNNLWLRFSCIISFSEDVSGQTMGQRVMGHGLNGLTNVNRSRGSRVSTVNT